MSEENMDKKQREGEQNMKGINDKLKKGEKDEAIGETEQNERETESAFFFNVIRRLPKVSLSH